MDKSMTYAIIGGLVGAVLVLFLSNLSVNNRNYGMMNMMGMRSASSHMKLADECPMMEDTDRHGMDMSMNDMMSRLTRLSGEEFDREFLTMMIDHHQGAIEMAETVLAKSQDQRLRDLAEEIISAQTNEIEMMSEWLAE